MNVNAQYDMYEEINPSFYNPDMYTVSKDSSSSEIVERYTRKDNSTLNWVRKWTLDERGNIIKKSNLDTLGQFKKAVICSAPMIKFKYDNRNNPIEISYWRSEELKASHDCRHFHREERMYDKKSKLIYQATYAVNGRLRAKMKFKNDARGNIIEVAHLDENNKAVEKDGSIICLKYDKENRIIKRIYKTHENKRIKEEDEISFVEMEYVDEDRIEISYNFKKKVLKKVKISSNGIITKSEDLLKK